MKVSKKVYRDRQNQATGTLIGAGIFLVLLSNRLYKIVVSGADVSWDTMLYAIAIPVLLIIWRIRERKLKQLEIED